MASTTSTLPNVINTNISSATIQASTGITSAALLVTGLISSANLVSTTSTLPNVINTNISSATIQATTGITSAALLVTGLISSANLVSTTSTLPNVINTNISSATIQASTGITSAALLVTGLISSANLVSTTATIPNIIHTNITTTNLVGTNLSVTSAIITNASSSNMYTTILTSGNVYITDTTVALGFSSAASIISAGGASFRNMWLAGGAGSSTGSTPNQYTPLVLGWNSGNPQIAFQRGDGSANTITIGVNAQAQFAIINNSGVSSGGLLFQTNSSRPMYFTGGNVGIGTSNPGYALDVVGTANFTTSITSAALYSTNITSTNIVSTTSTIPNIIHTNITTTSIIVTGSSLNATFNSNTIGNIFTTGGNVGIGTTSPTTLLDVRGNSRILGLSAPTSLVISNTTAVTNYIEIGSANAAGNFSSSASVGDGIIRTNNNLILQSGIGAAHIYINTSGNVGISTTAPAYNLDINGTLRGTGQALFTTTTDAIGLGSGGSLTVLGGAAISKSLFVGNGIVNYGGVTTYFAANFAAANNVSTAAAVTGLLFPSATVRSFFATLSINLSKSGGNLNAQVTLEGIQKDSGWVMYDTTIGDSIGLVFSIDATGQIYYTSPNYAAWVSTSIRYEGRAYTISGTFTPTTLPTSGNVSIAGQLSITNTAEAATTSTASLTVSGGLGVAKSLLVGSNLNVGGISSQFTGSFAAANNVVSATDVSGFIVPNATFGSFTAIVNVRIVTNSTTYNTQYYFEATQTSTGWILNDSSLGDSVSIVFTITSSGQIQYTHGNYANWQSTTINFTVTAINLSSGFTAQLPTSGNVNISGNLAVANTIDASTTSSASLVLSGGMGVAKSLLLGGNLNVGGVSTQFAGTFAAANNVITAANITGLLFPTATIRSFTAVLSINVVKTGGNLYSQMTVEGIQTVSGWFINDYIIGDSTGIVITITSAGQVQYTSPNFTSWTSTTINFTATAVNISATYTPIPLPTGGTASLTGPVVITNSNISSNLSSGALSVAGGVGIAQNLLVNNGFTSLYNSNTIANIFTTGGNVGINTTAPISLLHIAGVTTITGGGLQALNSSNTIGTSLFTIAGTGASTFVGINTTSPSSMFQVNGNAAINTSSGSNIASLTLGGGSYYNYTPTAASLAFGYSVGAGGYNHYISSRHNGVANNNGNSLDFWIQNTTTSQGSSAPGTGNVNALSVTATGIGIFTSTPGYTLDINGSIRASSIFINSTSIIANGGTTTLTTSANTNQVVTGTVGHTVIFPPATGLSVGAEYYIINQSTQAVTVGNNANTTLNILNPGCSQFYTLTSNTAAAGTWGYLGGNVLMGSTGSVGIATTAPGGYLQISTTALFSSNGNLTCTGDVLAYGSISDVSLKTNIATINKDTAIDTVKKLRPVTFNWKDDVFNEFKRNKFDSGFIAQEVEQVIEHAVGEYTEIESNITYKNLKHERIIPYLLSTVQYLLDKVDQLEAKLNV